MRIYVRSMICMERKVWKMTTQGTNMRAGTFINKSLVSWCRLSICIAYGPHPVKELICTMWPGHFDRVMLCYLYLILLDNWYEMRWISSKHNVNSHVRHNPSWTMFCSIQVTYVLGVHSNSLGLGKPLLTNACLPQNRKLICCR